MYHIFSPVPFPFHKFPVCFNPTTHDAEAKKGFISPATDRKFHEELLAPLDNPLAVLLLQVFWRVFDALVEPHDDVTAAVKSADRHHQILLAIKASDSRGARVAVRAHFEGLRERLGMQDNTNE